MSGESEANSHHKLIQEEHVKTTLKADKGHEAKITSWSIEDFTQKGDNYATAVTSIHVSYQLKGKPETTSYVVKTNRDKGVGSFKSFVRVLFQKESGFYEHIAPQLNSVLTGNGIKALRIPKWYHSFLEKGKELIFLEDLRPRGFKMFDRKKGMDVPHTVLVLEELARLHAASIILHGKRPLEDLAQEYDFLNLDWHKHPETSDEDLAMMFGFHYGNAAEMLHKIGGYEKAEEWLQKSQNNVRGIMTKYLTKEEPFVAICHGDCWNNNVLFRYDDEGSPVEVMLVDLQISRVASPATDLNYLICTSLTGDTRTANENHFLTSYHNKVENVVRAAGGSVPFTFQQLFQEYRKKHEFGLLFAAMSVVIMVLPSEDTPDLDQDIKEEDIPRLMAEWKEKILGMMEQNPLFRPRFLALFDFMMDRGVFG